MGTPTEEVFRMFVEPGELVEEGDKMIMKYDSFDLIIVDGRVQDVVFHDQDIDLLFLRVTRNVGTSIGVISFFYFSFGLCLKLVLWGTDPFSG